jgi:hypothetical protein
MTRLYAIPSLLLLILMCAVAVAVAIGAQIGVHRRFNGVDFLQHNEVGGFIVTVVGTLYAVTLAFVVSIVWQEYDGSATRTAIEAADAATAWHLAVGLPEPVSSHTRTAVVKYARLMILDEWPAMRHGGSSAQGEGMVTGLLHDLAAFRPANSGESNVQAQVLERVEAMHAARHQRLADNASGIAPFQWTILFIGAAITVGFCFLFGLANQAMHNIMTGAVACIVGATFVLIFELDYPFRGDLGISSEPWLTFMHSIGSAL